MIYFSGKYVIVSFVFFFTLSAAQDQRNDPQVLEATLPRAKGIHRQLLHWGREIPIVSHILFLAPGQYTIAAPHGYIFVGKMSRGSALKTAGFLLWRRLHAQRLLLRSVPSGSSWHPFKWSRVRNPMLKWHVNLTNVHMHITVIIT